MCTLAFGGVADGCSTFGVSATHREHRSKATGGSHPIDRDTRSTVMLRVSVSFLRGLAVLQIKNGQLYRRTPSFSNTSLIRSMAQSISSR
jgi:hypothetical protein